MVQGVQVTTIFIINENKYEENKKKINREVGHLRLRVLVIINVLVWLINTCGLIVHRALTFHQYLRGGNQLTSCKLFVATGRENVSNHQVIMVRY